MPTTDLQRALDAIVDAITAATNALGADAPKFQCYTGTPTSTKITEALQQYPTTAQITLWPLKARNQRRYPLAQPALLVPAAPGTTVELSDENSVATFGGSPKAGDVVHAFFGTPVQDGSYLVQTGDTPATIATAIAAAINALQAGAASASGDAVTLDDGLWFSRVNIGGTGTLYAEVGRIRRSVQATIWMQAQPSPDDGTNQQAFDLIAQAILANVGTAAQTFLTDAYGLPVYCAAVDDASWDADPQLSYSIFKWTIVFDVEYGITTQYPYTQLEGIDLSRQIGSFPEVTQAIGGP